MKQFKPLLAPNEEIDIKILKYPLLASYKIDGIRCILKDGQMFSRSLKSFPNIRLRYHLAPLKNYCKDKNILLDGELYCPSLQFNELSGLCRQLDKPLPEDFKFYCFDMVRNNEFNEIFCNRIDNLKQANIKENHMILVEEKEVNNPEEANRYYEEALEWGCDGLILRNPLGIYKFGRARIKENIIFKMKPFRTFDAKIIRIGQATEVREEAEKKVNELGMSVTSKKKEDRILIDKASVFYVIYDGKELKVSIALTDEEKIEIWKNQNKYIGRWIEYKGMLVGSKDLPRHPTLVRLREDKDE